MQNDLLYKIALTQVPNIGSVRAKILLNYFENDVSYLFNAKQKEIAAIEGIGMVAAKSLKIFDNFREAEKEIEFIEKYKIEPLFLNEPNYPKRLLNAYDAPVLLYYKGDADLNNQKIVAIVGTRTNSDYGKKVTEKLIADLVPQNALILSGLAFGIDSIAHKASLKNNLATVGVLAHGLDKIYPPEHTKLAKDMITKKGGLLTEFRSKTKPDRHNFPSRNRIVAALADVTVVVETDIKGGSMITAELANNYNKDVMAFPGKSTDVKSIGCNYLIKTNKANLITQADDLIQLMGWQLQKVKKVKQQRSLFLELSSNEKKIVDALQGKEQIHIDELYAKTGLTSGEIAASLLSLEIQSVIQSLPGKMISLL